MPYPHREPVSEEEFLYSEEPTEAAMFREAHPGHKSVCQTLRDIYEIMNAYEMGATREHSDIAKRAKVKLRLAWAMMKAMNDRLHYYKNKYEPWRKHV